MNKSVLIGRLTRDPELRYTTTGKAVTSFTLAVNRGYKTSNGEEPVDFIPIVVWGAQAENCVNYIEKGSLVAISGEIHTRSYEDKNNIKRWVTEIVANEVQFLSYKSNKPTEGSEYISDDITQCTDDDIPF